MATFINDELSLPGRMPGIYRRLTTEESVVDLKTLTVTLLKFSRLAGRVGSTTRAGSVRRHGGLEGAVVFLNIISPKHRRHSERKPSLTVLVCNAEVTPTDYVHAYDSAEAANDIGALCYQQTGNSDIVWQNEVD